MFYNRANNKIVAKSACVALAVLAAVPTDAATFAFDIVLDPATLSPMTLNSSFFAPVDIAVGDTVDLTFRFANAAVVTIANNTSLWTALLAGSNGQVISTGQLSFIDGVNVGTTGSVTQSNEFVHAGNFFSGTDYRTGAGSISFSGIRQVFTIEDNLPFTFEGDDFAAGPDPRSYNGAFFYYDGELISGAVPEPATWTMLIGGFGAVGGTLRHRRSKVRSTVSFV